MADLVARSSVVYRRGWTNDRWLFAPRLDAGLCGRFLFHQQPAVRMVESIGSTLQPRRFSRLLSLAIVDCRFPASRFLGGMPIPCSSLSWGCLTWKTVRSPPTLDCGRLYFTSYRLWGWTRQLSRSTRLCPFD